MFYAKLEGEVEELHYKTHDPDEEYMRSLEDKWSEMLNRTRRVAKGTRAHYIALGNYLSNKEGEDLNIYKSYRVFRAAMKQFGKDDLLLFAAVDNMSVALFKYYPDDTFFEDMLDYGEEILKRHWDNLYQLDDISQTMTEVAEFVDGEKKQRALALDMKIRESIFRIDPSDASNIYTIIYDSRSIGHPLKTQYYEGAALNLARQGRLIEYWTNLEERVSVQTLQGKLEDVRHMSEME